MSFVNTYLFFLSLFLSFFHGVGLEGIEPITYRVRAGCSTFELQTHFGLATEWDVRGSNPCLRVKSSLLCP